MTGRCAQLTDLVLTACGIKTNELHNSDFSRSWLGGSQIAFHGSRHFKRRKFRDSIESQAAAVTTDSHTDAQDALMQSSTETGTIHSLSVNSPITHRTLPQEPTIEPNDRRASISRNASSIPGNAEPICIHGRASASLMIARFDSWEFKDMESGAGPRESHPTDGPTPSSK